MRHHNGGTLPVINILPPSFRSDESSYVQYRPVGSATITRLGDIELSELLYGIPTLFDILINLLSRDER